MEWVQIFQVLEGLVMVGMTFAILWVRKLTDELTQIRNKLQHTHDSASREHAEVLKSVSDLSAALTTEVRGIVRDHADHDKTMVRIEKDVAYILSKVRKD